MNIPHIPQSQKKTCGKPLEKLGVACKLGQLRLLGIDPFARPQLRPQRFVRSFEQGPPPRDVAGAHPDHQAARLILNSKRPKKVKLNEDMGKDMVCLHM